MKLIRVLVLTLFPKVILPILCPPEQKIIQYYKVKECYKSDLPFTSWKNVADIEECKSFANQRSALAFNFIPNEARNLSKPFSKNCELFSCPEVGNSTTLIEHPAYDYYSAYGNLNRIDNSTCLRFVGLFKIIYEYLNYTESVKSCQNSGGDLASIHNEARTNFLGQFLESYLTGWFKTAYAGLEDLNGQGNFEDPMGYNLRCSKFRAWSPSHPRRGNRTCVAINAERTWITVKCKKKLPAVCELYPENPPVTTWNTKTISCDHIQNKRERRKCLQNQKLLEVYNNSSRLDKCALIDDFSMT